MELLNVRQIAGLLKVSARQVHRMRDMGTMPQPVKLGRLIRWRHGDIEQWIAEGCPPVRAAGKAAAGARG